MNCLCQFLGNTDRCFLNRDLLGRIISPDRLRTFQCNPFALGKNDCTLWVTQSYEHRVRSIGDALQKYVTNLEVILMGKLVTREIALDWFQRSALRAY